jgi:hypothetical protein
MTDGQRQKQRVRTKRYRDAHPERMREFRKAWDGKNPEKKREHAARFRIANKGKRNEYSRRYYQKHKEEIKAKARIKGRQYYKDHADEIKEYSRKYRKANGSKYRKMVFAHYGERCSWPGCNVVDYDMLQIDHINGGGNAHRKEVKSDRLPKWLIEHGYPDGFRILCANHNQKHAADLKRAKAGVLRVS